MPREELSAVTLIFGHWVENSASLLATAKMGDLTVSGKFSAISIDSAFAVLRSIDGNAELSIPLQVPETIFWYWEPREFSGRPEYAGEFEEFMNSTSDSAQFSPTIGIKFSVRVAADGFTDLLISTGKVLLAEWPEK